MKKLTVFVCGYSRAGKTTFLAKQPYPTASTSKLLDLFTANFLLATNKNKGDNLSQVILNLQRKQNRYYLPDRDLKIKVAEEIIIPTIGRGAFVKLVLDQYKNEPILVFESIGGVELTEALKLVDGDYLVINLRHREEQPGVDIRQLYYLGSDLWLKRSDEDVLAFLDYIETMRTR